jgi:hypothetical protein
MFIKSLHGGNACYLVVRKCQSINWFYFFFTARQLCKHSHAPYVSAYYNIIQYYKFFLILTSGYIHVHVPV